MSRHGFRFVHATCLCLDEHLIGTGPLSVEDRALAEDATFLAWDTIVETCLSSQAEFLILTGNSFNAKTNSLRARVALEKGFETLAAENVAVFIVPGILDPASAWKRSLILPPNVTILSEEDSEPVAVMSEKRVLASIHVVATAESDEATWSASGPVAFQQHQTPFRIGLVGAGTPIRWENGQPLPVEHQDGGTAAATLIKTAIDHKTNYIALGEGLPRTEHHAGGIIHDPGCAQSLTSQVPGSRGASIVNVDSIGEVTIDAVAVAPIRWEEFSLTLEPNTNQNDLIEKMALTLLEQVSDNDEQLWIINWKLSGSGPLMDSLKEPAREQELFSELEEELTGEHDIRRVHRIERSLHAIVSEDASTANQMESGLLHDFQKILEEAPDALIDEVRKELLELDWVKKNDARLIREAMLDLSKHRMQRRARALASHWLE